jgi:predicted component of type VI protein secretion system
MKLSLVVAQGNPVGKEIPIRLSQFVIGRDPDCHLRPASPLVSKRHCAIIQRDNQVFIRDFNSTNGTFVNKEQLKGERQLQSGDELRLGPLVFTVKITDVPSSSDTLSEKVSASLAETQAIPPAEKVSKPGTGTMPALKSAEGKKAGSSASLPALKAQDEKKEPSSASPPKMAATPPSSSSKPKVSSEDDDIAALLFNLEGDDSSSASKDQIPQGTTVMESLPKEVLEEIDAKADEASSAVRAPERKSNKAKFQDHQATAEAAKSILDQYMRRSRGQQR